LSARDTVAADSATANETIDNAPQLTSRPHDACRRTFEAEQSRGCADRRSTELGATASRHRRHEGGVETFGS